MDEREIKTEHSEAEERPVQKKPVSKKTPPRKRKKRATGSGSQILAVLIVFLAFYLAFSLFIAAFVLYSFNDTAENTEIYSVNVIYDEETLYKINAESANNEYGLYIPFEYLSEIGSFGLAGEGNDVTMFIVGTENKIEFTVNSSLAIINGNPVRISAPLIYKENEYYIPVMLLDNYINGIDVTYDNEKMVCNVSADIGKTDIELTLLLPEAVEPLDFPDEYKYYGDELSQDPTP